MVVLGASEAGNGIVRTLNPRGHVLVSIDAGDEGHGRVEATDGAGRVLERWPQP
jgi:hypothetical protein